LGKILCFVYDTMADFEMTLAAFVLADAKREIIPVGLTKAPVQAMSGLLYLPAATLDDVLGYDDVDGLIIPGGMGKEHPAALTRLIKRLDEQGKLLAAICAGPKYLARAGVLHGRKYTTTADEEYLGRTGWANPFPDKGFVNQHVVRDGNVITSTGSAFVDFAVEIADFLGLFTKPGEKEMWAKEFKGLNELR